MNEIDRLMDLDPLELSAQDIDEIIKYQRKMKANFEAGVKTTRQKTITDAPKMSLQELLGASIAQNQAPTLNVRRR